MPKKHMKSYSVPKQWDILRKGKKYLLRPLPGPHGFELGYSLAGTLKKLGLAKTTRDAKKILTTKKVLVDERQVKEMKFPVGFMDTLHIPEINKVYRIGLGPKGLAFIPTKKEEAGIKVCKITGKKVLKGKKLQLNLSDGRNILTSETKYKTGDGLAIETPKQTIKQHIPLQKGTYIILTGGKYAGDTGTVASLEQQHVTYKNTKNQTVKTLKSYAYPLGDEKPIVNLHEPNAAAKD